MGQPKDHSVVRRVADCVAADRVFPYAVTLAFFFGAGFVMLHHEMWRDELIPLMTGRASRSLSELIWNIRYEGHAPGWYIIVYAITRVTRIPEAMQFAHLLIATSSIFLIARFAPIPKTWRLLYAFGFYPFYQYAVVSRGYALCILLLFAFCALYGLRRTRLILPAAVLCLLAIADTYGWLMSVALAATLVYAYMHDRKHGLAWTNSALMTTLSASIIAFGIVWSALVSMPPADCGNYGDWHTSLSWERIVHVVYSLSFIFNFGSANLYLPFNFIALVVVVFWLARRRVALFMFAVFVLGAAAFYYLKFDIVVYWHRGTVFEYLIACIWVSFHYQDERLGRRLIERVSLAAKRLSPALVWTILLFFVVYGIKWQRDDLARPYSSGKAVARYIQANYPSDVLIAGDSDFSASTIAGYLDRPIYYPASDRFGTFLLYDNKRRWPISMEKLYTRVRKLSLEAGKDILLALSYELPEPWARRLNATLVRQFGGSVMVDENFWLYLVSRHG